jgi:uncharacterized SAM-binding protein YcdF (DUF218 family)
MRHRVKRLLFQSLFFYLPLLAILYILGTYLLIRRQAGQDEAQTADFIVILGAAQYNGRPSPVFKARLDHAVTLFQKQYAPRLITTGGHGIDPRYSEADVGKSYLIKQQVPAGAIETEPISSTTTESIANVIEFLQRHQARRVIAVSDGYHLFRIQRIFRDNLIVVFTSPAPDSPIEARFRSRVMASLREVFVYTAYRVGKVLGIEI